MSGCSWGWVGKGFRHTVCVTHFSNLYSVVDFFIGLLVICSQFLWSFLTHWPRFYYRLFGNIVLNVHNYEINIAMIQRLRNDDDILVVVVGDDDDCYDEKNNDDD